jgi:hypothetical protein
VLVFVCFSSCYLLLRRDYDWRILVPIVSHIQTHKREHTIKITNTKRIRVTQQSHMFMNTHTHT